MTYEGTATAYSATIHKKRLVRKLTTGSCFTLKKKQKQKINARKGDFFLLNLSRGRQASLTVLPGKKRKEKITKEVRTLVEQRSIPPQYRHFV